MDARHTWRRLVPYRGHSEAEAIEEALADVRRTAAPDSVEDWEASAHVVRGGGEDGQVPRWWWVTVTFLRVRQPPTDPKAGTPG